MLIGFSEIICETRHFIVSVTTIVSVHIKNALRGYRKRDVKSLISLPEIIKFIATIRNSI